MVENTNLTDYILERAYGKGESFNRDEINSLLDNIRNQELDLINIVLELPTTDIRSDRLYLVYNPDGDEGNLFDVFIYIQGKWEQLDGLNFKISDYYTQSQMDGLLGNKANSSELNRTKESLETVRDNLTGLYSNLTEFNKVLLDFNEDNTTLSSDLSKLKDNLSNFTQRVGLLITGLDTLNGELNGDPNNPNDTGLKGELEDTKSSLSDLQGELTGDEGLSNSLQKLRTDLEGAKSDIRTVQGNISTTQNEIDSLKTQDTNLTVQLGELSDGLSSTTNSLGETNDLLAGLRIKFENLNSDLETTNSSLSTAQGDIVSLQGETRTLTGNLSDLDGRLTSTNTTLSSTENSVKALGKQLNGDPNDPSVKGLSEELEDLQGNVDTLNSTTGELSSSLTSTQSKLDNITNNNGTGSLDTISNNLSVLHDEVVGTDGNGGLKKNLSTLNTSLTNTQDEVTSLQSENNNLKASVTTLSNDLNGDPNNSSDKGLKGDLKGLSNSLYGDKEADPNATGLVGNISVLSSNLDTLWGALHNTDGSLVDVKTEIVRFDNELNQFITDLGTLGESLTGFEGNLNEFIEQNPDLATRITSFGLDSKITELFVSIGSVRKDVSGLEVTVHGDPNDDKDNGLVGGLDNLQTDLYGDPDNPSDNGLQGVVTHIQDNTIPSLENSIGSVESNVGTVTGRVNTIENTTIPNVTQNIRNVDTKVDKVNEVIGDEDNPKSLKGQIHETQTNLNTLDNIVGDETKGLVKNINTAQTDIQSAKSDINTINNTTIPNVKKSITETDTILHGSNGDNGLINTVQTTKSIVGDSNSGLVKELNTAQTEISNAKDSIGTVQNELYGGEGYTFDRPSDDSYINLLNTTNSDLETAKTDITNTQTHIDTVEGQVVTAREKIDESIAYINNVQKIVYGDHTFYYTCNENEWSNISIDTSSLTGDLYVKFIVYPINDIMVTDISSVSNGDFNNDLTGWTATDSQGLNDEGIAVESLTENNQEIKYCRLTSNVKVMILSQENVDFTDVNSLTFKVRAIDKDSNPLTDITNGLFVYVGDEENNTGLLDTLSNFTSSLSNFNQSLTQLDADLGEAKDRITVTENEIDNNIYKIDEVDNKINGVNNQINSTNSRIDTVTNTTIPNVQGQVNDVKTIVSGDPNKPTDKGLVGTINNITNTDGTGSLDKVQNNITDITGNKIPNLQGQIDTTTRNIGTANQNITNLENSVGAVDVSKNGNLQNQVFNINQINDLIKKALNNAFTSPSSLNNNTKYIFIPTSSESISSNYLTNQEYNIMKYEYGFPMDDIDYFLMRNHASYYKRNSSTLVYIDEEDLVEELEGYNVVYVCYSLSGSGLSGNLGNDYDNKPLFYDYLYEISSKKYYGLHFGAVPIDY